MYSITTKLAKPIYPLTLANKINIIKVLIPLIICLLVGKINGYSQDPIYSQFYSNLLYLNPAYAGEGEDNNVFLSYRNQWPGYNNAFINYFASYDQYFEDLHGGVGLMVMNDREGDGLINKTGISLMYSYHLEVNRDLSINMGLQGSYNLKSLNTEALIFPDMIDRNKGIIYPTEEILTSNNRNYADFSFGAVAGYKNYYGGFALHHLNKTVVGFSDTWGEKLHRKFTLHAGANFPIQQRFAGKQTLMFSPTLIFQHQYKYNQINYGFYLSKQPVFAGLWLRNDLTIKFSSLVFALGYSTSAFRMGYSYDFNLSNSFINFPKSGAHEVTFLINFQYNEERLKMKAIKCPKI